MLKYIKEVKKDSQKVNLVHEIGVVVHNSDYP